MIYIFLLDQDKTRRVAAYLAIDLAPSYPQKLWTAYGMCHAVPFVAGDAMICARQRQNTRSWLRRVDKTQLQHIITSPPKRNKKVRLTALWRPCSNARLKRRYIPGTKYNILRKSGRYCTLVGAPRSTLRTKKNTKIASAFQDRPSPPRKHLIISNR